MVRRGRRAWEMGWDGKAIMDMGFGQRVVNNDKERIETYQLGVPEIEAVGVRSIAGA